MQPLYVLSVIFFSGLVLSHAKKETSNNRNTTELLEEEDDDKRDRRGFGPFNGQSGYGPSNSVQPETLPASLHSNNEGSSYQRPAGYGPRPAVQPVPHPAQAQHEHSSSSGYGSDSSTLLKPGITLPAPVKSSDYGSYPLVQPVPPAPISHGYETRSGYAQRPSAPLRPSGYGSNPSVQPVPRPTLTGPGQRPSFGYGQVQSEHLGYMSQQSVHPAPLPAPIDPGHRLSSGYGPAPSVPSKTSSYGSRPSVQPLPSPEPVNPGYGSSSGYDSAPATPSKPSSYSPQPSVQPPTAPAPINHGYGSSSGYGSGPSSPLHPVMTLPAVVSSHKSSGTGYKDKNGATAMAEEAANIAQSAQVAQMFAAQQAAQQAISQLADQASQAAQRASAAVAAKQIQSQRITEATQAAQSVAQVEASLATDVSQATQYSIILACKLYKLGYRLSEYISPEAQSSYNHSSLGGVGIAAVQLAQTVKNVNIAGLSSIHKQGFSKDVGVKKYTTMWWWYRCSTAYTDCEKCQHCRAIFYSQTRFLERCGSGVGIDAAQLTRTVENVNIAGLSSIHKHGFLKDVEVKQYKTTWCWYRCSTAYTDCEKCQHCRAIFYSETRFLERCGSGVGIAAAQLARTVKNVNIAGLSSIHKHGFLKDVGVKQYKTTWCWYSCCTACTDCEKCQHCRAIFYSQTRFLERCGSGVGIAAVQLARTVKNVNIAGISSIHKHDFLKEMGVKQCVSASQDFNETVNALNAIKPNGFDLILDTYGGEASSMLHRLLKPLGRRIII
ncbi:hypothetical protein QYM36_006930, partial [Artemia franciscana]